MVYENDWFAYGGTIEKGKYFHDAATELLAKLYPHRQKIKKACGAHQATLLCVFYIESDRRPYIHFTPNMLANLHDLGAEVLVDYTCYRSRLPDISQPAFSSFFSVQNSGSMPNSYIS